MDANGEFGEIFNKIVKVKSHVGLRLQTILFFHAFLKEYGVLYCKNFYKENKFPRLSFDIYTLFYSLSFTSITLYRYWIFLQLYVTVDDSIVNNFTNESLQYCNQLDVYFIKTYLIGVNAIVALNLPLLLVMISYSARGSICDIRARRCVTPLLYLK